MNSCFFIGHSDTPEDVLEELVEAIDHEINQNSVTQFFVGNHGRFDSMVCRALRAAKRQYPHICCYLVTAYHPGSIRISAPDDFDGIIYPFHYTVPPRFALPRANREMIDQCDVLIAAISHPGRSREVFLYAKRREKSGLIRVVNLSDR